MVETTVTAGEVVDVASKAAGEHLMATVVFDQYSGAGVDDGKHSIGLGLTWQHHERTLNEDEVNTLIEDVLASLKQRFKASLR